MTDELNNDDWLVEELFLTLIGTDWLSYSDKLNRQHTKAIISLVRSHPLPENDECDEIIKAVAHIGIDWGYGKYELEPKIINKARKLYETTIPKQSSHKD